MNDEGSFQKSPSQYDFGLAQALTWSDPLRWSGCSIAVAPVWARHGRQKLETGFLLKLGRNAYYGIESRIGNEQDTARQKMLERGAKPLKKNTNPPDAVLVHQTVGNSNLSCSDLFSTQISVLLTPISVLSTHMSVLSTPMSMLSTPTTVLSTQMSLLSPPMSVLTTRMSVFGTSSVRVVNSDVRVVNYDDRVVNSDVRVVNSGVRVVNSDVRCQLRRTGCQLRFPCCQLRCRCGPFRRPCCQLMCP